MLYPDVATYELSENEPASHQDGFNSGEQF